VSSYYELFIYLFIINKDILHSVQRKLILIWILLLLICLYVFGVVDVEEM